MLQWHTHAYIRSPYVSVRVLLFFDMGSLSSETRSIYHTSRSPTWMGKVRSPTFISCVCCSISCLVRVLPKNSRPRVSRNCPRISSKMEFAPSCFYEFLGVERSCSCKVALAKAYRRKSLQVHPDKQGGSEAVFQHLTKVFRVLSDEELRRIYDAYGEAAADQHIRNSEITMELDELAFEEPEEEDEEEDYIPNGYAFREMEVGEAMVRGGTVKMDMTSGRNLVLEKLEGVPEESYRHWMEIREIILKHDWEVVKGALLSFTFNREGDRDVFEAHFTNEEGDAVFRFEIVEHNLFRNDWDGRYAKLYKRPWDDCYVLQLVEELWVGHRRKRGAEDHAPCEKRPRLSFADAA